MPDTIRLHRCRFVDWNPSAVTAIALPPRPLPSPNADAKGKARETEIVPGFMAVGRANGDIELYQWAGEGCAQAWVPRQTLAGPVGSKVSNLVFTLRNPVANRLSPYDTPTLSDLRLFSTTGGTDLFEWDLRTGKICKTLPSQGGSIWSIAPNPSSTALALGCEDGGIRIVSLRDGDLLLQRRMERVKARLLSIAWGPPVRAQRRAQPEEDESEDEDEDPWEDTFLVTGCSDSSLRKWDFRTGRAIERLTTDKVRDEPTLVWAVGVLGDGTIVSGDSMGNVKFWDGLTCTQLQSFPSHAADILALTIGPDGQTVYSTGVDQKITQHALVSLPSQPPRWVQTVSRRLHAHDVSALAISPPFVPHTPPVTRTCPILLSGGMDMAPVLTPAATAATLRTAKNRLMTSVGTSWAEAWQRRLAYVHPNMAVAPEHKFVAVRGESSIGVWWVGGSREGEEWGKGVEMELQGSTNLVCMALGEEEEGEGCYLAASDGEEVKVWSLTGPRTNLRPRRMKDLIPSLFSQLPPSPTPSVAASALVFTPDGSRLLIATTPSSTPPSTILVIDLKDKRLVASFGQHATRVRSGRVVTGRGDEDRVGDEEGVWIRAVTLDVTGRWAASVDVEGRCNVFNMKTLQHHSTLPTFANPPLALAFLPCTSSPATLLLALCNNTLVTYEVPSRTLDSRTQAACDTVSSRLQSRHDPIIGVSVRTKPSSEGEVFIWGAGWMCRTDLHETPAPSANQHLPHFLKRKRSSGQHFRGTSFRMAEGQHPLEEPMFKVRVETRYKPLSLVDFVGGRDMEDYEEMMLIVERPIADVLASGPPAWGRKKYGT